MQDFIKNERKKILFPGWCFYVQFIVNYLIFTEVSILFSTPPFFWSNYIDQKITRATRIDPYLFQQVHLLKQIHNVGSYLISSLFLCAVCFCLGNGGGCEQSAERWKSS